MPHRTSYYREFMAGRKFQLQATFFAVLLAMAVGCTAKFTPEAAPAVSLQTLDYDGVQKLVASHKGKVVVMDCWSTSCAPCIQEFPKLVALHKKYGPGKLACISLSFDYEGIGQPEEVKPGVLAFLEKQQATFDNVLCSEESDALRGKLDLAGIPAVYVYDRDGNYKRFEGSKAYDEVLPLVDSLIKK
ncbi:MAG: TlpA family protein disulfide reductase [Pirellulales bacterium]|nr:TlpA family protein disulfide reductase [Pirellulales bacterium]